MGRPSLAVNPPALAAIGLAVAGVGLRLREYLSKRSLWLDEAMLAENITGRAAGGLLEPLWNDQAAPVGFLLVERALFNLLGGSEYVLRLVPLLAGVALLPVVWVLARRLVGAWPAALAVGLVALSPSLIRYSTEVKQYSTDALVVALLVLVATRVDLASARQDAAFAAGGAVAVWFSHAAVIALVAVGVVLVVASLRDRDAARLARVLAVGAVWVVSLAVLFVVNLRDAADSDFLRSYWASAFAPTDARFVTWAPATISDVFDDPGRFRWPAVVTLLAAGGAVVAVRRAGWRGWLLVAPLAVLVAVSAFEIYPVQGRLVLFLVPLMAVALGSVLTARPRAVAVVAGLVVVMAAVPYVDHAAAVVDEPTAIAELRPVLEAIADDVRPEDAVWVQDTAVPVFRHYAPVFGLRADASVWRGACTTLAAPDAGRLWYVYAYRISDRPHDEADRVMAALDGFGRRVRTVEGTDASAALFEVTRPATHACVHTKPFPATPAKIGP